VGGAILGVSRLKSDREHHIVTHRANDHGVEGATAGRGVRTCVQNTTMTVFEQAPEDASQTW
jgi:hypothetical protein